MTLAQTIRDQIAGARDEPAIHYRGRWYDRVWVRDRVERLEAAIRASGVPDDAPIGLIPQTRPEFAAALLALFGYARPIVMLYAYQSAEALAGKLRELKLPAIVLASTQWTQALADAADEVGAAAIVLDLDEPAISQQRAWRETPGQRRLEGEAGIDLLSSGTTGPPKHFHISYAQMHSRMVLSNAAVASEALPLLSFFPLGNISGVYVIMPALTLGQRIVLIDKFNIEDWLAYVREYRPRNMGLPTAAFRMILDAGIDPDDLRSFEALSTGASTLDPVLRREFEARYRLPIIQSYGATEFGGIVAITKLEDRQRFGESKADSVGRPCPGVQLRIVDPDTGEELPGGQEGRLEVLAPDMQAEWIATTDLGVIDEDGFLFHRGRLDGAIMRGGFKVLPEQIAGALLTHSAVAAAAVVGVADSRLGAVPAALIQLREGEQEPAIADLDGHIRSQLPAICLPKKYKFIESLPRTPSLKVDLAAVRQIFEQG